MKRFVLLLSLCTLSFVMAGELQSLHRVLAEPSAPAKNNKSLDLNIPGVQTLPGFNLPSPKVDHNISEIGLERTRCLTNCPAYTFIVQADGSFRYVGEFGVERLGDFTGRIEQGRLNQVLAFIAETDFFAFDDSYSASFLDGPTSYTLVTQNADTKVIQNYANTGPATLWAIEQLIDSLLLSANWD